MNRTRFEALLAAYGGREEAWPAAEREAALLLLDRDEAARAMRFAARELDIALDAYEPETPDLSASILDQLPKRRLPQFLAWLFPSGPQALLRPALLGLMPLVLGVVIGVLEPDSSSVAGTDWESQEQRLIALSAGDTWYE